ncbi:MAG: STAS domain-containing protein [Planctomycetes bacterium]|nr:STAS domain-containing protein [Planctomycetota bacterium]MCB9935210.1 STAS domain-containing protein [Planctomycetota bacterium]
MLKRLTDRIRKAWAETAPVTTAAPRANPFAQIEGRLNLRNAGHLRDSLWKLLWDRQRVVALDCSKVRFMDTGALAVLIEFAQQCKDTGVRLRLVEPSEQVCSTFSMYGLDAVLVSLAEFVEHELDGMLIVIEEEFPDSIRLEAVTEPLMIEEEEFPESIRIQALPYRDAA